MRKFTKCLVAVVALAAVSSVSAPASAAPQINYRDTGGWCC